MFDLTPALISGDMSGYSHLTLALVCVTGTAALSSVHCVSFSAWNSLTTTATIVWRHWAPATPHDWWLPPPATSLCYFWWLATLELKSSFIFSLHKLEKVPGTNYTALRWKYFEIGEIWRIWRLSVVIKSSWNAVCNGIDEHDSMEDGNEQICPVVDWSLTMQMIWRQHASIISILTWWISCVQLLHQLVSSLHHSHLKSQVQVSQQQIMDEVWKLFHQTKCFDCAPQKHFSSRHFYLWIVS